MNVYSHPVHTVQTCTLGYIYISRAYSVRIADVCVADTAMLLHMSINNRLNQHSIEERGSS